MLKRLWVIMTGRPDQVEHEVSKTAGPVLDPIAAQERLMRAETSFLEVVRGVVEENEHLRRTARK